MTDYTFQYQHMICDSALDSLQANKIEDVNEKETSCMAGDMAGTVSLG